MRLQGELHLLQESLAQAEEQLPTLQHQVTTTKADIEFKRERIIELHAAIAALEE